MTWWQILLAIVFTVPWIYLFIMGLILQPISQNSQYKKDYIKWNEAHPNLQRRKCKNCKYAKKETLWSGRYPNGTPTRHIIYCSYTRRKISGNHSCCIIPNPPSEYFYEPKDKKELYPNSDTPIYYSAYGNCYHSTPNCRSIKNSIHLYQSRICLADRYPCPKCWTEKDGYLTPKIKH